MHSPRFGEALITLRLSNKRRRRHRQHDPMLVLNMALFNSADSGTVFSIRSRPASEEFEDSQERHVTNAAARRGIGSHGTGGRRRF